MKALFVAAGLLLSVEAFAGSAFEIEITDVKGTGCPNKDAVQVDVDPVTGQYNIIANFNEEDSFFTAASSPEFTNVRVNCTIDYNLILAPKYKLDYAEFLVDGQYNLSETGTAFFSIRHAVPGIADPTYHNVTKKWDVDDADGNWKLFGSIDGIDEEVNHCGATIPLQVQIRATARQARTDSLDTFVSVDNAEGDIFAKKGKRKIKCSAKPVKC